MSRVLQFNEIWEADISSRGGQHSCLLATLFFMSTCMNRVAWFSPKCISGGISVVNGLYVMYGSGDFELFGGWVVR